MKVAVIGGGAAGFFAAIAVKENHPAAEVTIFEKTGQLLSKVKVSGGGRCNVTNACGSIAELCKAYPRGGKKLKKIFEVFHTQHTMDWFKSRGVPLIVEEDGRVFPASHSSQTIIDCLLNETKRLHINILTQNRILAIDPQGDQLKLQFKDKVETFDKVIVTTGGSPQKSGLDWLEQLHHLIEDPVPSLFTFNMPKDPITRLMGVVVKETAVHIQGTRIQSSGPLLVTHWGMSGPAILKLSAFGARELNQRDYQFSIQVNWANESHAGMVMGSIQEIANQHPGKLISNVKPFGLPERLWLYLLNKIEIPADKPWDELGKKGLNKLVNILTNDIYTVDGKTTFKEEFVTCGGVSLDSIDLNTMQSRVVKNLYFAGEVLDIDAITGGYNFQAAWTTGHIAGQLNE